MNKKIKSILFIALCLFSSAQPIKAQAVIPVTMLPPLTTLSFDNVQKFFKDYPLIAILAVIFSILGYKKFQKKPTSNLPKTPKPPTSIVTYDHSEKSLTHIINSNEHKIFNGVESFSVSPNGKILSINQSIYQLPIHTLASQAINKHTIDSNNQLLNTVTRFFDMKSGELIAEYNNILTYQYNTQEDQLLVLTYQEPSIIKSLTKKSALLAHFYQDQDGLQYSLLHIPSNKDILPQKNIKTAFFDADKLIIIDEHNNHHSFIPFKPETFLDVAKLLKKPRYYTKEETPQPINTPYIICSRDNVTKTYSITLNNQKKGTAYNNIKTYRFVGKNHLLLTYKDTKTSAFAEYCPSEQQIIHQPLEAAKTITNKLPHAVNSALHGIQHTTIIDINSKKNIELPDTAPIAMCSYNPNNNTLTIIQNTGNYVSFDTRNNSFKTYKKPHALSYNTTAGLSVINTQSQQCTYEQLIRKPQHNNPQPATHINTKIEYNSPKKTLQLSLLNNQEQQTFENVISYNFSPNKHYILINQIKEATPLIEIIGQVLWQKIDGKQTLKLLLKKNVATTVVDLASGTIKKSFDDVTSCVFHDNTDNKMYIHYPRETLGYTIGYDQKTLHYQMYTLDTSELTDIDQTNSPFNNITYIYNELTKNYDLTLAQTHGKSKTWTNISNYQIIGDYILLTQEIDETDFDTAVNQLKDIVTNKQINIIDALFNILDKTKTISFLIHKETGDEIEQFENVIMSTLHDNQSLLLTQRKEKTVNYSLFNLTTKKKTPLDNADATYCTTLINPLANTSYADFNYISSYLTSADFCNAKRNTPSPLTALIEKGIRGFILPLYDYTGFRTNANKIEGVGSPTLCVCDGPAATMNYNTYQSLSSILPKLLEIMNDEKYKNDIFTIILENHSKTENSSSIISKELERTLPSPNSDPLVTAAEKNPTNQWPTIGKLRKKGKRLIIFQNNKNNQNHNSNPIIHPITDNDIRYQCIHKKALHNPYLLSKDHQNQQ